MQAGREPIYRLMFSPLVQNEPRTYVRTGEQGISVNRTRFSNMKFADDRDAIEVDKVNICESTRLALSINETKQNNDFLEAT